jgi:serine/threonine protein kinase
VSQFAAAPFRDCERLHGACLFIEGQPSDAAFQIIKGQIELTKQTTSGPIQIAVIGAGEILGEMGVLDDSARSATARAVGHVSLRRWGKEEFLGRLKDNSEDSLSILRKLARRLRDTNEVISQSGRSSDGDEGQTFLNTKLKSDSNCPIKLGKYKIMEERGRGAIGVVYRAIDTTIERAVAIKIINIDATMMDTASELADKTSRLKREARAAGSLHHTNIVAIYEYAQDGPTAYIAMEFIDGCDLKEYLNNKDTIELDTATNIMKQLLSALEYAHKNGIVHRDIKPANIMIAADGRVKITDFGIARLEASNITHTGALLGTPAYMSPEQILGQPADARSDIFSAGAVLYQLLTKRKPFIGSIATIMNGILYTEPKAPSAYNPNIPRELDLVVLKALAKRPEDRFSSAAVFEKALADIADGKIECLADICRTQAGTDEITRQLDPTLLGDLPEHNQILLDHNREMRQTGAQLEGLVEISETHGHRQSSHAYPVNTYTYYMLDVSSRQNKARHRSAPRPRPRCPATI